MMRNVMIGGALLAAAEVGLAAPGHADELDFISQLDHNGIYYSSINDMIDLGKVACHGMRAHMDGPSVGSPIASRGYTHDEVVIIMTAAATDMCPDVLPWIHSVNTSPAP